MSSPWIIRDSEWISWRFLWSWRGLCDGYRKESNLVAACTKSTKPQLEHQIERETNMNVLEGHYIGMEQLLDPLSATTRFFITQQATPYDQRALAWRNGHGIIILTINNTQKWRIRSPFSKKRSRFPCSHKQKKQTSNNTCKHSSSPKYHQVAPQISKVFKSNPLDSMKYYIITLVCLIIGGHYRQPRKTKFLAT